MSGEFLLIGSITGVSGLDGVLKIICTTDFPLRFAEGRQILVDLNGFKKEYTVDSFQLKDRSKALLSLKEISDRESAHRLCGSDILIPEEDAREFASDLKEDEFLFHDLLQCKVYQDEKEFGTVADIYEAGGGIVLSVSDGKHEYQIPFVREMVDTSAVKEGRITIFPIEGLMDQ